MRIVSLFKTGLRFIVNIGLFFAILLVIQLPVISGLDARHVNIPDSPFGNVVRLGILLITFFLGMLFCYLYSGRLGLSKERLSCHLGPDVWKHTLTVSLLIVILLSAYFMSTYLIDPSNVEELPSQIATRANRPVLFIVYATALVVTQPILEEFLFRGILLEKLAQLHPMIGLFISSLLFSYVHGNNTLFNFQMLGGLIFGYLYIKTKRLLPAILVHILYNAIVLVAILLVNKLT